MTPGQSHFETFADFAATENPVMPRKEVRKLKKARPNGLAFFNSVDGVRQTLFGFLLFQHDGVGGCIAIGRKLIDDHGHGFAVG